MATDATLTLIGRSSAFRGELTGGSDVQIDGKLEGSVYLPNSRVVVGPEARVRALLQAKEIIVHGRVEGEVRTPRADFRSSATVVGDVFAVRLSVEQGAVLHGNVSCRTAAEETPGVAQADAVSAEPQEGSAHLQERVQERGAADARGDRDAATKPASHTKAVEAAGNAAFVPTAAVRASEARAAQPETKSS